MHQTNRSEVKDSGSELETKKATGSVVITIILVVLLLIVAGAAGFLYYRYSQTKGEVNQLNSQVNDLNSQIEELNSENDSLQDQIDLLTTTPSQTSSVGQTTQAASSCTKTGTMPTNGYVISDSNSRIISESELKNLTPWQLKVARNEIYARHGRAFIHQDLSCYFASQNWYSVNSNFSSSLLSYTENKNIATIINYEKSTKSSCLSQDSGC